MMFLKNYNQKITTLTNESLNLTKSQFNKFQKRHLRRLPIKISHFKHKKLKNKIQIKCHSRMATDFNNGIPFDQPKSFFSGARDLSVNGMDLLEEMSEISIDPKLFKSTQKMPISEPKSVSYFGLSGSFSEMAAKKAFPNCKYHACKSWGNAIEELFCGHVDRAVVPIESHYTRRTRILYDILCKYDLYIVGEKFLKIEQSLLVLPGMTRNDIKCIISHIQALFQCEKYILTNYPNVKLVRTNDTAESAARIANENLEGVAAIAHASCAEKYGLTILDNNIQDRNDNITRFVILARWQGEAPESGPSKTSIMFALPHDKGSGVLGEALKVFAEEKINLLWLDSRQLYISNDKDSKWKNSEWHYLFYINLEGSMADEKVKRALHKLEDLTLFMRIMGSHEMEAKYLEDVIA